MRILFVENHAAFAEVVTAQFLAQHEVVVRSTLAEAMAETSSFDAVLVDYDLDDGKGDTLIEALRRAGFAGPIIAVSSHEEGNRALLRAGANAVCAKAEFGKISTILEKTSA